MERQQTTKPMMKQLDVGKRAHKFESAEPQYVFCALLERTDKAHKDVWNVSSDGRCRYLAEIHRKLKTTICAATPTAFACNMLTYVHSETTQDRPTRFIDGRYEFHSVPEISEKRHIAHKLTEPATWKDAEPVKGLVSIEYKSMFFLGDSQFFPQCKAAMQYNGMEGKTDMKKDFPNFPWVSYVQYLRARFTGHHCDILAESKARIADVIKTLIYLRNFRYTMLPKEGDDPKEPAGAFTRLTIQQGTCVVNHNGNDYGNEGGFCVWNANRPYC